MALQRGIVGMGLGIAAALFAVSATDAEARVRKLRARHAPRGRHRFKSAPSPTRAKTPAVDSNGATDTSSSAPVAGAPAEGAFRKDVVDGGTLLAMSPDRALVLNAYRGLLLVDTSDASAPRTLASVSVQGTGERMLLGEGEVAVVSDSRDSAGAWTLVTSVSIGDASLTVAGVVRVDGSLRDVAREGDDLLLVTGDSYWGPIYMMAGRGAADGSLPPGGAPEPATGAMGPANSDFAMPYGGGQSRVARVRVGAGDVPSVLGAVDVTGDVLCTSITGTDAVLAVQSGGGWVATGDEKDPNGGGSWTPPTLSLVRYSDDSDGAPTSTAKLDLADVSGVALLDRDGTTLRAVEYKDSGEVVATFDLAGGGVSALGTFALDGWPSAIAFSGDAFLYGVTDWRYDAVPPADPVFDRTGVAEAFNDMKGADTTDGVGAAPGFYAGPTSTLHSVDLSDPSHPVAGGDVALGDGWLSAFTRVPDGVVGTLYDYSAENGATTLFRIDATNAAAPSLSSSVALTGYANLGHVLGDVLLVDGGTTNEDGAFRPSTRLIDLSGGGLSLGGSFSVAAWTSAAARDSNLLGLASYDRLTLVDIADRANPQALGEVRLVVNVAGFAALDATTGAVLATDYVGGGIEIRTVSLPEADALAPLDVVNVATGDAQMFAAAPYLYVVATDWGTGRASLTVVDATDPAHLEVRGSLDLARYPGQVFLKGRALLLLRQAWSLNYETEAGGAKVKSDSFGRCPQSWLRHELAGVLDVVDLSDPDRPRASARLPLDWDPAGAALLSGNSLYVPSYVNDSSSADGAEQQYAYMIQEINVRNPLRPTARTPQNVPGTLAAATGDAHRVLTTEYAYDNETGATTTSLHVVDLSLPASRRVLATAALDGYPDSVTVGEGQAFAVVTSWGDATLQPDGAFAGGSPTSSLLAFDLSDLSLTRTTARDVGAYAGEAHDGYLFLRTWGWTGSIDEYSLASPGTPVFVQSREVAGLAGNLVVIGGRAYAAGGMYGVESFELAPK